MKVGEGQAPESQAITVGWCQTTACPEGTLQRERAYLQAPQELRLPHITTLPLWEISVSV